ncbi:MAG: protein kinase domain-containing protein, partial [Vicinamibacterales bacterium]
KPANIKLRPDGVVKVLDFGLAKALEPMSAGSIGATASPTISSPAMMTGAGMILGTAAYMSPEQAKGRPADKRADIWAFGCVLYEMLTGRRAFAGEDVTDVLVSVLGKEPDWRAMPHGTPAAIRRLLQRCLEKDRRERLPDIGVARLDIKEALTTHTGEGVSAPVREVSRWRRIAAVTAIGLVASATTGAAVWFLVRPGPPRVTRTTVTPSNAAAAVSLDGIRRTVAMTPDGTSVVYVGSNSTQIFVRAMDRLEATALTGLGTPNHPFVSPDGQWIGFFDGAATLKKVAITGGPAVTLCPLPGGGPRGATWGVDGTIIFADQVASAGLWRVSAAGGEPTMLTKPNRERGEADHLWPEFLPDGKAVLFTIAPVGPIDNAQVAVLDLQTGTHKVLVRGGSHAHYLPSGHLVYGVGGTLRAVAFDLARLEVVGTPTPVLPQVITTAAGAADFDVAPDGTLVYVSGGVQATARTLVWVDRMGREEAIKAPVRAYMYPRLSPDGTRLALDIRDQENDIWIWDFRRETLTRFTFDAGLDRAPAWTPDGRRVLFSSERAGAPNVFWQAADGTGAAERLTQSPNQQFPFAVSPDGTRLVLYELAPNVDLMMLTLDKARASMLSPASASTSEPGRSGTSEVQPPSQGFGEPRPLIQTPYVEQNGDISPDGRWLAYESNNSGQLEIYVRPFPDVDSGLWQVSTGGGTRPLWARNGLELFYRSPTGTVMSVRVERGAMWAASTPTRLFEGPYFIGGANFVRTYDVSPDGRRFLMIKQGGGGSETAAPPSLIVVQNWFEELKRLVPGRGQ